MNLQKFIYLLIPITLISALVRLLFLGEWSTGVVVITAMIWIQFDIVRASIDEREEKKIAHSLEKKESKDKSDVEKLQERITKLELAYGFKGKRE